MRLLGFRGRALFITWLLGINPRTKRRSALRLHRRSSFRTGSIFSSFDKSLSFRTPQHRTWTRHPHKQAARPDARTKVLKHCCPLARPELQSTPRYYCRTRAVQTVIRLWVLGSVHRTPVLSTASNRRERSPRRNRAGENAEFFALTSSDAVLLGMAQGVNDNGARHDLGGSGDSPQRSRHDSVLPCVDLRSVKQCPTPMSRFWKRSSCEVTHVTAQSLETHTQLQ